MVHPADLCSTTPSKTIKDPLSGKVRPDYWIDEILWTNQITSLPYHIVGFATDKAKYIHSYEYQIRVGAKLSCEDLARRKEKNKEYENSLSKAFRGDRAVRRDGNPAAFAIRDVCRAIEPRLHDEHITTGNLSGKHSRQEHVLLRQAAQSLAGPRHLDAQCIYPDAGESGTKNKYEQAQYNQAQEFIDKVAAQLQHGELSRARRWAGKGMHQDSEAFDIFTALWWQIGNRSINRDAAWLAMKLLVRFPWLHANSAVRDASDSAGAPAHLAQLLGRHHASMKQEQQLSFYNRFQRLLSTPLQQTEHALMTLIPILRRGSGTAPVLNWGALIMDLGSWGAHRTQRRWAHDFLKYSQTRETDHVHRPAHTAKPQPQQSQPG